MTRRRFGIDLDWFLYAMAVLSFALMVYMFLSDPVPRPLDVVTTLGD